MDTTYYTPREVAERLKLRVQTVYAYIREGRLPAVRLGNRCRIAQADLDAFLQRQERTRDITVTEDRGVLPADQSQPLVYVGPVAFSREELKRRNQALLALLDEWMADESGYDERAWPIVEKLLAENPVSFGEPPGD